MIAGGGTGGHLFPGLAVAQGVLARGGEVLFVGCGRKIEALALAQVPFAVETIKAEGVLGRPVWAKLRALVRMGAAVRAARHILRRFGPQGVLGVGGYASVPVLLAARLLGIPCAIHEQNSIPGLANRFLARLAARVFVSFAEAQEFFPAQKVIHTGNPIRQELLRRFPREHKGLGLLITGGSQGARALNRLMLEVVPRLSQAFPGLFVIHQTGFADHQEVARVYAQKKVQARVLPFIEDMAWAYAQADLVVCRAGATTIAELCALGKPAVYIPFPYATHGHQERNAAVVVARGAGVMFREKGLSPEQLYQAVADLLANPDRRRQMAQAARQIFPEAPVDIILQEMEALTAHAQA